MSWWEIYVEGVKIVVSDLADAGATDIEYTYNPNLFPQIICQLRNKKIGIFLNPNLASQRQLPDISRNVYEHLKSKGISPYIADVNFAPIDINGTPDRTATSLNRGDIIATNYNGELWQVKYFLWKKFYSRCKI